MHPQELPIQAKDKKISAWATAEGNLCAPDYIEVEPEPLIASFTVSAKESRNSFGLRATANIVDGGRRKMIRDDDTREARLPVVTNHFSCWYLTARADLRGVNVGIIYVFSFKAWYHCPAIVHESRPRKGID